MHAVVLVGVGLAAAKYLNGAEVLDALRSFDYLYAPFALLLSAAYLGLKGWRFVLLMRPLSGVAANPIFGVTWPVKRRRCCPAGWRRAPG